MEKAQNKTLLFILLAVGLIWLRSSYGKISGGNFVEGLAGTLDKFASKNPYPLVKQFLLNVAIPNAHLFGTLVMLGEAFTALSIVIASVYLLLNSKTNQVVLTILSLGLIIGIFLNATFWFASGWTSPSTDGLNLLMFAVQLVGFIYVVRLMYAGK